MDFDLTRVFENNFNKTASIKVWANYVYLDTEERRRFAQKGHEYLIEQVQHTGDDTVSSGSTSTVRLSYNHPVKELVWCYSNTSTVGDTDNLWNFCGPQNPSQSTVTLSVDPGAGSTADGSNVSYQILPHHAGAPHLIVSSNVEVQDLGFASWAEEGNAASAAAGNDTSVRCVGPLKTFNLVLNGQDRFKAQSGKYFNQVQPYCHHSGTPYPGIYSYSFALKPEEHQPTGTCNFSRIDNAQTSVTLKAGTFSGDNTIQSMFAVNYNVLRIQSGMGGLAFSN